MYFLSRMFPIAEKLGGWIATEEILRRRGIVYSKYAKKKWFSKERGKLPREAALALSAEAAERGIAFSESDFELPPAAPADEPAAEGQAA